MVKEDDGCSLVMKQPAYHTDSLLDFLLSAKKNTYAAKGAQCSPSRPNSHDYMYQKGDFLYIDTYLGGECFSGEEAVWKKELPQWTMNYCGRVLGENFIGDFLKEALLLVPEDMPFRGPSIYQKGDYCYHCKTDGEFEWYKGYEDIYCHGVKVYECCFHGGIVK